MRGALRIALGPAVAPLAFVLVLACCADAATPSGDASVIEAMADLVAFWTFGEQAGEDRLSQGAPDAHPLSENGGLVSRADQGPFSGFAASLNGSNYFDIPHDQMGDLDIHGPTAEVSMIAFVKLSSLSSTTVAGVWSEGQGRGDDTGTRQYSLLLDMPAYGGDNNVCPHISSEGGVTQRADGTKLPWCVDYAAGATDIEVDEWISVGFTYDSQYIHAYYNGELDVREPSPASDNRTDRYFTTEGPDGGNRGMNPYYHGRGIFSYDPNVEYDPPKIAPSAFAVGARQAVGQLATETMRGLIGGLAVFDRALSDTEMLSAHNSARLYLLNGQPQPESVGFLADFTVPGDASNMSLNSFNAASGKSWQAVVGSAATALGDDDLDLIRVADSRQTDVGQYLAQLATDEIGFAWTDLAQPLDASQIAALRVCLNNRSTDDSVRLAVRIGDQWFATDEAYSIDPGGIAHNDWSNSQVVEFLFQHSAAQWRELDVAVGDHLTLGYATTSDLVGGIDGIGLLMQTSSTGLVRADDLTVLLVPEPTTAALLLAVGSLLRAPGTRRRQSRRK
jgi:hypothetical protein